MLLRRPSLRGLVVLLSGLALASASYSCGAEGDGRAPDNGDDGSGGDSEGGAGGSLFTGSNSGGGGPMDGLIVEPANQMMNVEYGMAGQTMQFTAKLASTGDPVVAIWALSTPTAGTIDNTGLFTSNGLAGGVITVSAMSGMSKGSTTLTIHLHILENPDLLTPADEGILQGGGGQSDPSFVLWYPYDKTIFPRGILPPELHPSPNQLAPTAYYLKISNATVAYEGFFQAAPQIQMSQTAWDALGISAGGGEVTVELAKLVNAQKYGPLTQTWRVAKGKLHGVVYYNTYDSDLAGSTGAMMRIKGNSPSPEVLVGNCTVCHSVSSDGSTAAAANHYGPGGTFDLSGGMLNPPLVWTEPERASFAALYPKNGEVLVINGAPGGSWPPNTPGTNGNWLSELRTKTGTIIPASGIESYYAQSPVFSHDGTMLAFTERTAQQPWPSLLSLLKYDAVMQKFTGYEVLATPPAGRHMSWPAFTPDGKWVVYQDGTGDDLATWGANTGKIWAVNVATKAVMALTTLNGDGYMPQGMRDEDLNYEPTIAPIGSGGYVWIMFTSRRTYGNRLTGDRNQTKRLWVAAFDLNAMDGVDPSHPAFYIAGQGLQDGNSRGFWALDPCKQNGQACETGDECCEGFCDPSQQNPDAFVCSPPSGECSEEFETCVTAADCCDPTAICVNGVCTLPPPR